MSSNIKIERILRVVWQPFYGSDNGYTFLLEAMRGTFL